MNPLTQFYHVVMVETTKSGQKKITKIPNPLFHWCADPFLFEHNGHLYIFAECASLFSNKGDIRFFEIGSKKKKWKKVIKEKYHLSFPNIFTEGRSIFIMPESSAINEVRLYSAINFPLKWKYKNTIIKNHWLVDSIIVGDYLLSYDNKYLYFFDKNNPSTLKYMIKDINNKLRPAGKAIASGGKIIIPFQNNTLHYGGGIIFCELKIEHNCINIVPLSEFTTANAESLFKFKKIYGTHTYNKLNNFEVYDIIVKEFSFLSIVGRILKKIRRK